MTNADAPNPPPFEPGALVRIKNRLDRCIHRVAEIERRAVRRQVPAILERDGRASRRGRW